LLEGRTCVVTGGANGLGRAMAERFVAEGARVVALDLEQAPSCPEGLRYVAGSVAEETHVRQAIEHALAWTGRLDVYVNDAAVQIEKDLLATSVEDWDRLMAVNMRGVFIGTREAARVMGRGGSIINLGSALGVTGDPLLTAYCASKGGVVNFTRAAAVNLGLKGIRVNCLCPGAVATPLMTRMWDIAPDPVAARASFEASYPMGRIVELEEIASAAMFLASDMSSAMTGAVLNVDCGLTAANPEYASVQALG
jgi:NAD(P)-dependent dehydrogenase (short-subunit alcohol dehydrogenase family)